MTSEEGEPKISPTTDPLTLTGTCNIHGICSSYICYQCYKDLKEKYDLLLKKVKKDENIPINS